VPSCTGNQKTTGCWVCPYCPKRITALRCLTVVDGVDADEVAPCAMSCRFFTKHLGNPNLLQQHIADKHDTNNRK